MKFSANKFIPGIGNKVSIRPTDVQASGGAEKFVPGLGKAFKFEVSEEGKAHQYIPGLGTTFFVNEEHTITEPIVPEPEPIVPEPEP